MLSFKTLIDNRNGLCNLHSEHGLSIFIEHNNQKILCDTGASALFLSNAESLGIEPKEIDFCFISHGHSDHTGGLLNFLQATPHSTPVYLSAQIKGSRFFSCRREKKRDISTNPRIFEEFQNRLHFITGSHWIAPDVAAVAITSTQYDRPKGNSFLTTEQKNIENPDNFTHELALAIKRGDGLVIFSPCSHNGMFNIIESCMQFTSSSCLRAFVGGLHLVEGCERPEEIEAIAADFMQRYPNALLYTGHCTSDHAISVLQKSMPCNIFEVFTVGATVSL